MRHDLRAEGFGIRLRPVSVEDAEFIHQLRCHPELENFIGPTVGGVEGQRVWIENYLSRSGDYYFCVERLDGTKVGTVGIYNIDEKNQTAEWGRWILLPGSQAAPASMHLLYRIAFEELGLKELTCTVVEDNSSVVTIH